MICLATRRITIALTYIYGIGRTSAEKIVEQTGIDVTRRVNELTDDELNSLRAVIENEHKVEVPCGRRRR